MVFAGLSESNTGATSWLTLRSRTIPTDMLAMSRIHPQAERIRLSFLDGIRGLAALYVVIHHAYLLVGWDAVKEVGIRAATLVGEVLGQGHLAVSIFIVLSGFCLMLPVAHKGRRSLRGNLPEYFRRRSLRILPAYYAALLLTLVLIAVTPGLSQQNGSEWDMALPARGLGTILSHLLLVHNLSSAWVLKINPPMWSVATEWQIYFLFPFVLLPLWRRVGSLIALLALLFVGVIPTVFMRRGDAAAPWFVGLFALGAIAAAIYDDSTKRNAARAAIIGRASGIGCFWLIIPYIALHAAPYIMTIPGGGVTPGRAFWFGRWLWISDYMAGAMAALLLLNLSINQLSHGHHFGVSSLIRQVFESKFAVFLGKISYSLYLTHYPLMALAFVYCRRLGLSANASLTIMIGVMTPLCVLFAFGFHRVFEQIPLSWRDKKRQEIMVVPHTSALSA
jgi:peptidoglycan/LPS O-acetylase OafA/YrhL